MSEKSKRKSRTTDLKKIQYDLLFKQVPAVVPYLWIPQSSRRQKTKSDVRERIERPWNLPTINKLQYISGRVHIPSLLWDTANILKQTIQSNGVVVYFVDEAMDELYVSSYNDDVQSNRVAWNIRSDSTVAAYVADQKKSVMLNSLESAEPYNGYDWKGVTVSGTLDVPIVTSDDKCFAILELYRRDGQTYNQNDLNILNTIGHWIAASIDHNKNRICLNIQQQIEVYLLETTQYYFAHPSEMHDIMQHIINCANDCLNSERGIHFSFDSGQLSTEATITNTDQSIAEYALNFKGLLNIRDAYADWRFTREHDVQIRHITRTALCMPIFGRNERTLGVLLIVNKYQGCFTDFDEQLFKIFVKYCIIILEYMTSYRMSVRDEKLALILEDLIIYRMTNLRFETQIETTMSITDLPKDLYEFSFYPSDDDNLVQLSCWLLQTLHMTQSQIAKFVFSVRDSYRNNPYHNFEHAFNVLHSVTCILERNPDKFSHLEKTSFLIAALCHDMDHRALTNQFLETSDHPFFGLYDDSLMENHHFFMTTILLESCPIRASMTSDDYKTMIYMIHEMILATNLTRHMVDRCQLAELCTQIHVKGVDIWYNNDEYRALVRRLITCACDLSGQTKPFPIAQGLVKNLMIELFGEAELMKQLHHAIPRSMDIQYIDELPQFQVQFIEIVCMPCFDFLQIVLPNTSNLYYSSRSLMKTWKDVIRIRAARKAKSASVRKYN